MSAAPLQVHDELCERMSANLAGFERVVLPLESRRAAAVALVITSDAEGRPCFVLTRRSHGLRAHAGQWALPGGRLDPGEDALEAALRELVEEVGLELAPSAALGLLDDYATRSGYVITPVVFWHGATARFALNEAEVAAVYCIPLEVLGRPEVPRLSRLPDSEHPLLQVPIAELKIAVHAPTAAILYQLWEVAVQGRSTRVHHFEQPRFAWR